MEHGTQGLTHVDGELPEIRVELTGELFQSKRRERHLYPDKPRISQMDTKQTPPHDDRRPSHSRSDMHDTESHL